MRKLLFILALALLVAACQAPQPTEPEPVVVLTSVTCAALDGGTIEGPALVLLSPYGSNPGFLYVYPGVKAEVSGSAVSLTGGTVEELKAYYAGHNGDHQSGCA